MSEERKIVGHKTFSEGPFAFRHEPLYKDEAESLMKALDKADSERREKIPDEKTALRLMMDAYIRLKELGWNDAIYCPKDGSHFQVIEAGSTGLHDANYRGEWPNGTWWVYDGDIWPSRPILFKPYPQHISDKPEVIEGCECAICRLTEYILGKRPPSRGTLIMSGASSGELGCSVDTSTQHSAAEASSGSCSGSRAWLDGYWTKSGASKPQETFTTAWGR